MSSTLYWKPVSKNEKALPDELKHALKKLDIFNNSIDGVMSDSHLTALRVMDALGVKGAKTLINAIEKYGEVELSEEY